MPNWPTQIWFPFLLDMFISKSFIISPSINQLELPSNMNKTPPLWQRLELMGYMDQEEVSGLKSIKQCGRPCHEFLVKRYT